MANIDPIFISLFHKQFPSLTEKEAQRALLFYLGFNASQIGEMLGVTRQAVLKTLVQVQRKLGVPSSKMLAQYISLSLFAGAFIGSCEVLREAKGVLQEARKALGVMK